MSVPTVMTKTRSGRNAVNRAVYLYREGRREVQVTRFIPPAEAEYIAAELRGALADAFHTGIVQAVTS